MRPCVTVSTRRLRLPSFSTSTFPCWWPPPFLRPSPPSPQPLSREMCLLFHLLDVPSFLPNFSPLTSLLQIQSYLIPILSAQTSVAPLGCVCCSHHSAYVHLWCTWRDFSLSTKSSIIPHCCPLICEKGSKNELAASTYLVNPAEMENWPLVRWRTWVLPKKTDPTNVTVDTFLNTVPFTCWSDGAEDLERGEWREICRSS